MPSNSSIDLQVTPQISKTKGSDYLHYKLLREHVWMKRMFTAIFPAKIFDGN